MEIKKIKLGDIKQNPRNPKNHDVEGIKASMQEMGEVEKIYVDENDEIIAGHGRLEALKQLGKEETEVIVIKGLTREQKDKYLLLSNKLQERGGWNLDMLANFSEEELVRGGWENSELDNIFQLNIAEDDFNAEEEHDKIKTPTTKPGDLYQVGDHRLLCGDSTKKEDVGKLMGGELANMIFTDPPYNMNIKGKQGKIMNDNMEEEKFIEFAIEFMARMKEASKTGASFYICSGYSSYIPFIYAMKENGLEFANPIVWVKNTLGMGMNDYRHSHEMLLKAKKKTKTATPILYGWNTGKHYFKDVRNEADVWEISRRVTTTMVHPTQKPLELVGRAIRNSSKRNDIVLDLFAGSGSTLISAEKEGRRCFAMELDQKYCDVIIARFEKFTGIKAEKID